MDFCETSASKHFEEIFQGGIIVGKETSEKTKELFFPYYVNQGRLLDIYAILNDGYSEYTELTTAISTKRGKEVKGEASITGGFKIFNFGSGVSGTSGKAEENQHENKEKKVQTVTSVLSIVKSTLEDKGYLKDILSTKPGDFICVPVTLKINSVKSLLKELSDLIKLMKSLKSAGIDVNMGNTDAKQIENIIGAIQVMFVGEEILSEADDYAIIGNIVDSDLYQATRNDIIGTDLNCLAQVKRVFPDGCELMKNTVFAKIKNPAAKEDLADFLSTKMGNNAFDFDAVAVASIHDKPVYQLEIIALYQ